MHFRVVLMLMILLLPLSAAAEQKTDPAGKNVVMETTMGTMKIELFDKEAPLSADNFRNYVKQGFYDGLIFHRVIPGFMIQGGGFEPGLKKKNTGRPIPNEATNGLKNKRGTLSMARTSNIHSATSQFFINVVDNVSLDHRGTQPQNFGYAVFGRVVEGMDVADKIVSAPTTSVGGHRDVPRKDIVILKAYLE
ncbi:MAG: peptidylprolyl isomerase [Proteobacteria bacterium]|nr:peptidylprolyl isomerase [Pseudomonadota bacterium]MBU1739354.1 peptidylprolyl isomerase [Pseudomonadota bacterium]